MCLCRPGGAFGDGEDSSLQGKHCHDNCVLCVCLMRGQNSRRTLSPKPLV